MYLVLTLFAAATASPPQPQQPSFYGQERDVWQWQQPYAPHADYRQEAFGNQPQHGHHYGNQTGYPWAAPRYEGHPQHHHGQLNPPPSAAAPPLTLYQPPPPPPPPNAPPPTTFHHPQSSGHTFPTPHPQGPYPNPFYSHQGPFNAQQQHPHPAPPPQLVDYPAQPPPNQPYPVSAHQAVAVAQSQRPAAFTLPQVEQQTLGQNARQAQPPRPAPRPQQVRNSDENGAAANSSDAGVRRFVAVGRRERTRDYLSPHLGTTRRDRLRDAERSQGSSHNPTRRPQLPVSPVVSRRRDRPPVARRRDDNEAGRRRREIQEHDEPLEE